jgi:F-type H+-transporting ATPase subunit gamma
MALQTKAIKKRIYSVKNIKKITRAMEMVAASKMRKATAQALATRTYAELALELLINIGKEIKEHALLEQREMNNILMIIIASNKGLCGSYNGNILKKAKEISQIHNDKKIFYITVGKKAERAVIQGEHLASFIDFSENPSLEEILPLSRLVLDKFLNKSCDRVKIIYTDFISAIQYEPKKMNLLPVSEKVIQEMIDYLPKATKTKEEFKKTSLARYLFEPDMSGLLDEVLPRLVEIQIYQSILEANASEHSARMMAMKNASENASEIIDELILYFNQARQAAITQEISEIASGAAALE